MTVKLYWKMSNAISSLCVFCGSSSGASARITDAGRELGALLAARGIELVYGGGGRGLMAVVADAVLQHGGKATGVIPRDMVEKEWAHGGLTELIVVDSMHERKAAMAARATAFAALPGGIGTIAEFFEVYTWWQLGLHGKPCALLNVDGYFNGLLTFLDHMVAMEFRPAEHRAGLHVARDPEALLHALGM